MIKILYIPTGEYLKFPKNRTYNPNDATINICDTYYITEYGYTINEVLLNMLHGSFFRLLSFNNILPVSLNEFEVIYDYI